MIIALAIFSLITILSFCFIRVFKENSIILFILAIVQLLYFLIAWKIANHNIDVVVGNNFYYTCSSLISFFNLYLLTKYLNNFKVVSAIHLLVFIISFFESIYLWNPYRIIAVNTKIAIILVLLGTGIVILRRFKL